MLTFNTKSMGASTSVMIQKIMNNTKKIKWLTTYWMQKFNPRILATLINQLSFALVVITVRVLTELLPCNCCNSPEAIYYTACNAEELSRISHLEWDSLISTKNATIHEVHSAMCHCWFTTQFNFLIGNFTPHVYTIHFPQDQTPTQNISIKLNISHWKDQI